MTTEPSARSTGRTTPAAPAVALYGLDASGKAHASWFGAADADLARRAAAAMGFGVLELEQDVQLRELAKRTNEGRIHKTGGAFTPFVARGLFDQLCAAGGVTAVQLAELRASQAAAAKPAPSIAAKPVYTHPADRDAIVVGSLVLAAESGDGFQEGWFAAVATDVDGDSLRLRWRDWGSEPEFFRHRDAVALLPPKAAAQG